MKTKVLVATGLTVLLGTGLYAAYNNQGMMKDGSSCGMQDGKHMMKKSTWKKKLNMDQWQFLKS